MGQSSNDVIPSAIHISAAEQIKECLVPALERLAAALSKRKRTNSGDVIKIGRTHLMDATPVRLGQEFGGYAQQVRLCGERRAEQAIAALQELALGGTAVGTGLNRHRDFPAKVMRHLEQRTGIAFREAEDHFEAQGAKDGVVEASGHLKTIAVSLFKIANDIRWLSSGPRCGIGEIQLPATQPGSSIMPGKVNPVICESVMMVCASGHRQRRNHYLGGREREPRAQCHDASHGAQPSSAIRLLGNVADIFAEKCVSGIEANESAAGNWSNCRWRW